MRLLMLVEEASEMVSLEPLKPTPLCPGSQKEDWVMLRYISNDPTVCLIVRSIACVADELSSPSSKVNRNRRVSSQIRPVKLVPL